MVVHPSLLRRLESVVSWKLYQYTLPMTTFGKQRQGLILETLFSDGQKGWGEIAPLPERSQENLVEVKEQLLEVLQGRPQPDLLPSVAFGLESALHPYQVLSTRFPLWALIAGSVETMREKAQRAQLEGFSFLKIKVSHLSCSEAESLITPLIGKFTLRIDVNRAWTAQQAIAFFSQFSNGEIQCIEEPTYELDQLTTFPFPFALDESLSEIGLNQLSHYPNLSTLIVKPTIIGGTGSIQLLKQLGKKILFTGAFESGIGIVQIAQLVYRLGLHDFPLGLDTYRFLEKDVLLKPLDFSQGFFQLPSDIKLNGNCINEVAHG